MLRNEIIENWSEDLLGNLHKIKSIEDFPAYTIKTDNGYGVAIPLENNIEVNEDFANAKLKTQSYTLPSSETTQLFLTLTTNNSVNQKAFSALCEQFVFPGNYGEFRKEITNTPIKWWMEMKQILGNRNVDNLIYDTLGELWTYDHLIRTGRNVVWNGPSGSSTDIECDDAMVEVKSTISRSRKEITIHGKTQLTPPENKELYLYYCVFEISANTGCSINDIVYGLARDGYDVTRVNDLLASKGLEIGKSARNRKFILWNVYKYIIDDRFPRISDNSFVGGKEPDGITSISYTVSLEGIPCEVVLSKEDLANEIQVN